MKKIEVEKGDNSSKPAVVKVADRDENGLIALNNDCLKSLMKVDSPEEKNRNSLSSYSDSTYGQNYLSQQ